MRTALLAAALLVPLLVPTASASQTRSAALRPALHVLRSRPLEIRGVRFRSHERVTVTFSSATAHLVRRVIATSLGTFTADFGSVPLTSCGAYAVTARGRSGSLAVLKVRPLCPPP